MGRRALGLVGVIVVIVAAAMVPMVAGRGIAGVAVALVISPAPQVGDCLVRIPAASTVRFDDDPGPRVVSCASWHDAEVITQTPMVGGVHAFGRPGGHVPDLAACAHTASSYFGVHPLDAAGARSVVLGPWWPAFAGDFEALGPSALQVRTGQSWAACVIESPYGSITGRAARLFAGSHPTNPLALCAPATDVVLYQSVSCDQPHPTEILGWRVAAETMDSSRSFALSCAELARRITGMADPTAQGTLQVSVAVIHSTDGPAREGWGPGHSGPYWAACTISTASSRMLTQSLTGLADAPLPWA